MQHGALGVPWLYLLLYHPMNRPLRPIRQERLRQRAPKAAAKRAKYINVNLNDNYGRAFSVAKSKSKWSRGQLSARRFNHAQRLCTYWQGRGQCSSHLRGRKQCRRSFDRSCGNYVGSCSTSLNKYDIVTVTPFYLRTSTFSPGGLLVCRRRAAAQFRRARAQRVKTQTASHARC